MLEHYIRDPKKLAAMKRNYLASYLEKIAEHHHAGGYHFAAARAVLCGAFQFVEWLGRTSVPPDQITVKHMDKFLRWYAPGPPEKSPGRRKIARWAARVVLRQIFAEYPPVVTDARSPSQMEADCYADHLRRNRGLAEHTVTCHRNYLEQFLVFCFRRRSVELSVITARRIHAYVNSLPHGRANGKRLSTCAALRGYFRFLQMRGIRIGNLLLAVPSVHRPRAALKERWLTAADAEQLLRSIDRSKAKGKRNYAVILCMIHLGLRVGDVARLSLDDIDWREGTVRVANHKPDRPYPMPLPRRLGQALVDYLVKGRLPTRQREIFLRHDPPHGVPVTVPVLRGMMRAVWRRAGFSGKFSGTHILRHSVATRMKQKGASLKSIADVLGHQSIQTTTRYAQVDLPALRAVAQPWPEVRT